MLLIFMIAMMIMTFMIAMIMIMIIKVIKVMLVTFQKIFITDDQKKIKDNNYYTGNDINDNGIQKSSHDESINNYFKNDIYIAIMMLRVKIVIFMIIMFITLIIRIVTDDN